MVVPTRTASPTARSTATRVPASARYGIYFADASEVMPLRKARPVRGEAVSPAPLPSYRCTSRMRASFMPVVSTR